MARLVSLVAGGQRSLWKSLGLTSTDHACLIGDVSLRFFDGVVGLHAWSFLSGHDVETHIDGIPTSLTTHSIPDGESWVLGSQKITGLDHVVVNTDNLDRTCAAITEVLGCEVRREREVGNGVVQRFHKLDNTILEVVTGPHVTTPGASLWGMVISVDDLFDYCEEVGDTVASPPKKATQPGRFISTVRGDVGLGVPLALMTPHVSEMKIDSIVNQ